MRYNDKNVELDVDEESRAKGIDWGQVLGRGPKVMLAQNGMFRQPYRRALRVKGATRSLSVHVESS